MNELKIPETIRLQVLEGHSDLIRSLLLNDEALKLLKTIKDLGGMTSSWLALKLDISSQSANGRLKYLMNKGYLKRREVIAKSGGIEHIYLCKK